MARKWTCALCGGEVVEGQRFTFLPGRGAVHVECLAERLAGAGREAAALHAANEALLYAIVRLKEAARMAGEGRAREAIEEARREVERAAGRLAGLLAEALGSGGT
jgi:hypothetical protein